MKNNIKNTLLAVFLIAAFQSPSIINAQNAIPNPPMVGGDIDANGCKPSTGASWSKVLNRCVRVWEVGVHLQSFNAPYDYQNNIIIFQGKNRPAELVGADFKNIILKPNGSHKWISDDKTIIAKLVDYDAKTISQNNAANNNVPKNVRKTIKIWKLEKGAKPKPIGQAIVLLNN